MSEMIERVAMAIEPMCRGFGRGDIPIQIAREFARAAIEAMREPTEGMCNAGKDAGGIRSGWILMIDTALK